jgi:hypothetical protein
MKQIVYACLIIVVLMLVSCGGSGGSGDITAGLDSDRTSVLINLGLRDMESGTLSSQAIPSSVSTIVIRISAPDMSTIERTINVAGMSEVMVEIEVPNGANRLIEVFAYNSINALVFSGSSFFDADGTPVEVTVTMVSVEDTDAPVFGGLQTAEASSESSADLMWTAASDNVSPPSAIVYLIYIAQTPEGENFASPSVTTAPGATSHILTGLSPLTTYYIVVRAKDEAGNIDGNLVEKTVTTQAAPDSTPPTFGGLVSATAASATTIDLQWDAASDNETQPSDITYDIFQSTTSGGQDFMNPTHTTSAGAASFTVMGLTPGTTYYYVVRARDASNNTDSNTEERSAATETIPDDTPPVTTASPPGGSHSSVQTVTLMCDDGEGSGCAETLYCLGSGCTPSITFTSPFDIGSSTDLRFYSTDNNGNVESTKTESYDITISDAGALLNECLAAINSGDFVGAKDKCKDAADAFGEEDSNDADSARFFSALAGASALIINIESDGQNDGLNDIGDFLDAFNCPVEGRDITNLGQLLNDCFDAPPAPLPGDSPTAQDIRDFLFNVVRPALVDAISRLNAISPNTLDITWTEPFAQLQVESDYGDVLALRAYIKSLLAYIHIVEAYFSEIDIDATANNELTIEDILSTYPDFLKLTA